MKHIRRFDTINEDKKYNENSRYDDAISIIFESFQSVKKELDLLDYRFGLAAGSEIEKVNEFASRIKKMKNRFDRLYSEFNDFENELWLSD